jgi:hypothetical protein
VLYRNDELDKAMTDGDWPHQVELPAYRCTGHNNRTMHFFCQELPLSPRTHASRARTRVPARCSDARSLHFQRSHGRWSAGGVCES